MTAPNSAYLFLEFMNLLVNLLELLIATFVRFSRLDSFLGLRQVEELVGQ